MKFLGIIFISIGLALFTCSFKKQRPYIKMSDHIVSIFSKELKKEKNLYLVGEGGAMMDDLKSITVRYLSFEQMDLEQARALYVGIAEEYFKRYNTHEKIQPYIHDYPFSINNLKLSISFEDQNLKRQSPPYLAYVSIAKNKIFYCAYDHTKQKFIDLHEEPYEEAVKIVKTQGLTWKKSNSIATPVSKSINVEDLYQQGTENRGKDFMKNRSSAKSSSPSPLN